MVFFTENVLNEGSSLVLLFGHYVRIWKSGLNFTIYMDWYYWVAERGVHWFL